MTQLLGAWAPRVLCVLLILGIAGTVALRARTSQRGTRVAVSQVVSPATPFTVSMPGGISVEEMAAPTRPPGGRNVMTASRAIGVAKARFKSGSARISATYGIYSNDQFAKVLSHGRRHLYIQHRPTWVVRFSGLNLGGSGGAYEATHPTAAAMNMNHELVVFVDAASGAYLGSITFR